MALLDSVLDRINEEQGGENPEEKKGAKPEETPETNPVGNINPYRYYNKDFIDRFGGQKK